MANKKSAKIFLIIGLAGVILSIIGTIIEIVYTYNIISQKFKTEPDSAINRIYLDICCP